ALFDRRGEGCEEAGDGVLASAATRHDEQLAHATLRGRASAGEIGEGRGLGHRQGERGFEDRAPAAQLSPSNHCPKTSGSRMASMTVVTAGRLWRRVRIAWRGVREGSSVRRTERRALLRATPARAG